MGLPTLMEGFVVFGTSMAAYGGHAPVRPSVLRLAAR